jgi:hypothetical protein
MKPTLNLLIVSQMQHLATCMVVEPLAWISRTLRLDTVGWLDQRSKSVPDYFSSDFEMSQQLPFAVESSSRIHDTLEQRRRKSFLRY